METPAPKKARKPRQPRLTLKLDQGPDPLEPWHQKHIFALCALWVRQVPDLAALFHVPNGGKRDAEVGADLKRQGVKAGVPDMLLLIPRGGYAGLIIELKRFREGQPSPEQKAWLLLMAAAGYRVVLCRGWRAAWREIWWYCHQPITVELLHVGGSPITRKDTDHHYEIASK